jgi:hypothetical protein
MLTTAAPLTIAAVRYSEQSGSFPVARSNAGGNRARGRHRHAMEITLDSFDTLNLNALTTLTFCHLGALTPCMGPIGVKKKLAMY